MGGACRAYWEIRNAFKILVLKSVGMRRLGRPTRRWRIILKWVLWKQGGRAWTGLIWLRIGTGDGIL
jgi:hypothetical protein